MKPRRCCHVIILLYVTHFLYKIVLTPRNITINDAHPVSACEPRMTSSQFLLANIHWSSSRTSDSTSINNTQWSSMPDTRSRNLVTNSSCFFPKTTMHTVWRMTRNTNCVITKMFNILLAVRRLPAV